jgi:hypothetical protein
MYEIIKYSTDKYNDNNNDYNDEEYNDLLLETIECIKTINAKLKAKLDNN